MLSLRVALQKCVRKASILGNSKICHHTSRSFNAIHISRLAYSNGNNEEAESASISALKDHHAQKPEIVNNKSAQDIVNDPETGGTVSVADNQTSQDTGSDPKVEASQSIVDKIGFNPAQNSKNLESNGNSEEKNTSIPEAKDLTEDEMSAISNKDQLPGTVIDPEAGAIPSFSDTKSPDMVTDSKAKKTTSITDTKSLPDIAIDPEPEVNSSFSDTKSLFGTSIDPEANEIPSIPESKALNTQKLEFRKYHTQPQTVAITDQKPSPDIVNDPEVITSVPENSIPLDMVNDSEAKETTSITDTKSSSGIANDSEPGAIPSVSDTKPSPDIVNDPEETTSITESKALNTTQNSKNATQSSKNLEFRKYHLTFSGSGARKGLRKSIRPKIAEKMLTKYFSRYGKVIRCTVRDKLFSRWPQGIVVFRTKEAVELAVNDSPHYIPLTVTRGSMKRAVNSSPDNYDKVKVTARTGTRESELTLRVLNLSPETTDESLEEFYSEFGDLTHCVVTSDRDPQTGESYRIGHVSFASHEELDRALASQPHLIDGSQVFLKYETEYLDIVILDLHKWITEESLRTFFSQYGNLRQCKKIVAHARLTFSTQNELDRALKAQPHILFDGSEVFLQYAQYDVRVPKEAPRSLIIKGVPEGITEESLRAHFSQYGYLTECKLIPLKGPPHAYLSYSTLDEINSALKDRFFKQYSSFHRRILKRNPLLMERKCLKFTLLVGPLPENATGTSLSKAFSKFGKIVHMEMRSEGQTNDDPNVYVSYDTQEELDKALENVSREFEDETVEVQEVRWDGTNFVPVKRKNRKKANPEE